MAIANPVQSVASFSNALVLDKLQHVVAVNHQINPQINASQLNATKSGNRDPVQSEVHESGKEALESTNLANNPSEPQTKGLSVQNQGPVVQQSDSQSSDTLSEQGAGANNTEIVAPVETESETSGNATNQQNIPAVSLQWHTIYSGMEIAWAKLPETLHPTDDTLLWIVRFDPAKVVFSVHMASQEGVSYTFRDWAAKYRLYAAMNASMYLPDQITSTGYLRTQDHTNNARLGKRLGAVFVASPKVTGIPEADILEMSAPLFQEQVQQYNIAIQNFRFMSNSGELLWKNSQLMASFAVIGKDSTGAIYFILCQQPLTPEQFAFHIRRYGLPLTTSMYVEGGEQAGLLLRADDTVMQLLTRFKRDFYPIRKKKRGDPLGWYVFKGRKRYLNMKGAVDMAVPNLLGVTPKKTLDQIVLPSE